MIENRFDDETLDAALHLLDRQVVDEDGLLVCKVDDLEVTLREGRAPAVTRILTGPAALVPRLSGRTGHRLRERWLSLGVQYADRDVPLCVPLDAIDRVDSAIRLSVPRAGLLDRQPPPEGGEERRRMGELLGATVAGHPRLRGKVLDVRVNPGGHELAVTHLLIGPGRPGSLLGYDRTDSSGPWMVATIVALLHRHLRVVPIDAVEDLDWDAGSIRLDPHENGTPLRES